MHHKKRKIFTVIFTVTVIILVIFLIQLYKDILPKNKKNLNHQQHKAYRKMEDLHTGDILLFHGENYWFSYLVEYLTGSSFSHVAMVLRSPTAINPALTGIYMIESGQESFPDAVCHRIRKGVQIVDLKQVIDSYSGTIYYRKLKIDDNDSNTSIKSATNDDFDFRHFMTLLLANDIWPKIIKSPYDENIWDLVRAAFDIPWGNNCRTQSFVCSALVSFLYEQFGLMTIPVKWDLITPKDFDEGGRIDKIIKYKLSSKVQLYKTTM